MKGCLFLFFILCSSCSPTSLEEYHYEGENLAKEIAIELAKVHTEEDLLSRAPRLKKKLSAMVDLMIKARKLQKKKEEEPFLQGSQEASDFLKEEFIRIYQIEGCAETMQEIQREALHRLDLLA